MTDPRPPMPKHRAGKVSLREYMRLFRRDLLSAQPAKLYRAWMAEFKTPFFRSYMVNQPDLVKTVLHDRPMEFPKSTRVNEGLRPLLGDSVFLTNGAAWERQRRIIDPAFEGGKLRETYPAMVAAVDAAVARLKAQGPGVEAVEVEVEEIASFAAADIIFRTLFSIPIDDEIASETFREFRKYQRSQPVVNIAALIPLPRWVPRGFSRDTKESAAKIRGLIKRLTDRRAAQIAAGTAPLDLATKIMTTPDPETGDLFTPDEMVDQVAIFFLAGHETSASTFAWGLYLLARFPDWQDRVAAEGAGLAGDDFAQVRRLATTRDVFREALRLYPPVPMMVRQTTQTESFRDRVLKRGAQIVLSPWHLHRHERLWDRPHDFDPGRWHTDNGKQCQRDAFIPFSAGRRVCVGAGFATVEGALLLAKFCSEFRFDTVPGRTPEPVAHLTVRAKDGIWLKATPRTGN